MNKETAAVLSSERQLGAFILPCKWFVLHKGVTNCMPEADFVPNLHSYHTGRIAQTMLVPS